MAASTPLLAHIHRLIDPSAVSLGSDAALLNRFVHDRDQAAFAVLVARHGPMVFRVCRRVLGDVHSAEDACQATFLVLARKAERIRHPETLAAWLHGVAHRLALKARAADVRRRQIETQRLQTSSPPSTDDPLEEVSGRELLAILDAELQRLPERYRLPLILCCLEGRSQPEAARLLGWTAGSVKGRLERGRVKLHRRLLRRGLTLSAALLALEATRDAALARLPALLNAAILRTVAASTAGTTAGGISTAVLALAEGGMRGLLPIKVKLLSVLVLMVGVVIGGAGAFVYPELSARQQEEKRPTEPKPLAEKSAPPKMPKEKSLARTDRYGDPLPRGALARLGTIRMRWGGGLRSSFFCLPDGKSILSASMGEPQMAVCQWRMATGELLQRWETPLNLMSEPAFSHDGKTLVTSGYIYAEKRSSVQLWDVSSRKVTRELKTGGGRVLALAVAPDDKWIATADDQVVRLWDFRTGTEIRRCQGEQNAWRRLVFSPDGKILAAANARHATIQLWETATGKELVAVEHGPVGERPIDIILGSHALAFSPDSKVLATSANEDKAIRFWDTATGKSVRVLQSDSRIDTIAFSPDGKLLASGDGLPDGNPRPPFAIRLWDAKTGREVRRCAGHPTRIQVLAFSRDGKRLLSSTGGGSLHIWDVASGKDALPFREHEQVFSIVFSPDGRALASGGLDGMVQLWEPASGNPARLFGSDPRHRVWRVGFTSNGRALECLWNRSRRPFLGCGDR